MPKHSIYGHGFIEMPFADKAAAKRGRDILKDYSHTTSSPPAKPLKTQGVKISSVDLMEDPLGATLEGDKRPEGLILIIDAETNPDPIGGGAAHDRLHALAQEVWGLAQAPGLAKHLCCISDM